MSKFMKYLKEEKEGVNMFNTREKWEKGVKELAGEMFRITQHDLRGEKYKEEAWLTEFDPDSEKDKSIKKIGEWDGFSGWIYKSL